MFELERLENIRRLLDSYEDTFELVHLMIHDPELIKKRYGVKIVDGLNETETTFKVIFRALQMHLQQLEEQAYVKIRIARQE